MPQQNTAPPASNTGSGASRAGDPAPAEVRALPGFERGRPVYFDNEVVDHLITVVLELGAEMWVLKDRQAFTEELLAGRGIDLAAELDRGRPSEPLQARLKLERAAMIKRIYGPLYSRYGGDKAELEHAIL